MGVHHRGPSQVQHSELVLEQAAGFRNRQGHASNGNETGRILARRSRAFEEDARTPWPSSLLGPLCPWSTHQDYRSPGFHCWCGWQEEGVSVINNCYSYL